ncbi:MAG TPA: twin-arginine translocase TatA/TatE family subunit [Gaiellaceae bacterium]|jgi:sec-independent protein translocase protein TatA|nr:twin-arginine translocase TatA/TatE family subunit [Gaiellaceae bacterium]
MAGWESPTHLIVLFLIALLLFGGKRLPEIGRSLGTGMREFKDSITHANRELEIGLHRDPDETERKEPGV